MTNIIKIEGKKYFDREPLFSGAFFNKRVLVTRSHFVNVYSNSFLKDGLKRAGLVKEEDFDDLEKHIELFYIEDQIIKMFTGGNVKAVMPVDYDKKTKMNMALRFDSFNNILINVGHFNNAFKFSNITALEYNIAIMRYLDTNDIVIMGRKYFLEENDNDIIATIKILPYVFYSIVDIYKLITGSTCRGNECGEIGAVATMLVHLYYHVYTI